MNATHGMAMSTSIQPIDWDYEARTLEQLYESGRISQASAHATALWDRMGRPTEIPFTKAAAHAIRTIALIWSSDLKPTLCAEAMERVVRIAEQLSDSELLLLAYRGAMGAYVQSYDAAAALKYASKVLALAKSLENLEFQAWAWYNLGSVFTAMEQHLESIGASEKSIALWSASKSPEADFEIGANLANISYGHLKLNNISAGLRAAQGAVARCALPEKQHGFETLALAEENYVQLLLQAGDIAKAQERASKLVDMSSKSTSKKVKLVSELALGITKVYKGEVKDGLDLLKKITSECKTSNTRFYLPSLQTLAAAYEQIGEVDLAVAALSDLANAERQNRVQAVLLLHERDISDLTSGATSPQGLGFVESKIVSVSEGRDAKRRLLAATMKTLENVAVTCETSEDPSGAHIYRVGRLSSLLAADLGHSDDFTFHIELAARLHDVGKLGVRQSLLTKVAPLTNEELGHIQQHVTFAEDLLRNVDAQLKNITAEVAKFHHEHWDGTGYPEGRAGEQIPIAARIVALADAFDSLTHWRPHRRAWPIWRALDEIERLAGTHFDPTVTPRFVALVRALIGQHHDLDAYLSIPAANSEFLASRRALALQAMGIDKRDPFGPNSET